MKIIIMRGIPGSGKSTFIKNKFALGSYLVFSADDYFNDSLGNYNYVPANIGLAHNWCFKNYMLTVSEYYKLNEKDYVIVDNTNISAFEIAPYVAVANACGIEYQINTLITNPTVAFNRNIHNVPFDTVYDMYRHQLNEQLPPFWKKMSFPTDN